MAKLILNPTSPQRQEVPLPRLPLSIGRDPSNDLVLADAMVSRRHATIEQRGGHYVLLDCNSSNGSLVNGNRVIERELHDGDLVYIGTARLLFREDAPALDGEGKVVRHPSSLRLKCAECRADYRFGDVFCRHCGAKLPGPPEKLACDACGALVSPPARFCNACGGRLPEPAGADTERAAEPAGAEAGEAQLPAPRAASRPRDESGAGDRTAPPPTRVVAVGGGAARALAAEQSWAPAARRQRPSAAPPRPGRQAAPRRQPAGFAPRLVAGALDALLLALTGMALLVPLVRYWWERDLASVSFQAVLLSLLLLALMAAGAALYYTLAWGLRGATVGQWLLGLVVEDVSSGRRPIGLGQAALRAVGYAVSAVLLGFGFLMIAFDGYGLHDRIAGTRVVYRDGR